MMGATTQRGLVPLTTVKAGPGRELDAQDSGRPYDSSRRWRGGASSVVMSHDAASHLACAPRTTRQGPQEGRLGARAGGGGDWRGRPRPIGPLLRRPAPTLEKARVIRTCSCCYLSRTNSTPASSCWLPIPVYRWNDELLSTNPRCWRGGSHSVRQGHDHRFGSTRC